MKISGPVNIITDDGLVIDGKTDNDLVTAQGNTIALNADAEISKVDNEVRFVPTEIVFSSNSYNLTSSSNFVILIYDGPHLTVNVTMDYKRGQTVYIVNRINTASIATPFYTVEGNTHGVKYYASSEIHQWLMMGTFEYRES